MWRACIYYLKQTDACSRAKHVRVFLPDLYIRRRHVGVSALSTLLTHNRGVTLCRYDPASAEYKQLTTTSAPQQSAPAAQPFMQQQQTQYQWTPQQWASMSQEQQQGHHRHVQLHY